LYQFGNGAQRNEPQNVWLSCLQSAAIKGVLVEEVAHITTTNAQQLFPRAFV
jgi:Tat protein secretion system quality control protein TatD with DNase activity